MQFKLAAGKAAEEAKEPEDADKGALKVKKIVCRLCKGDHVRCYLYISMLDSATASSPGSATRVTRRSTLIL